MLRRSIQFAAGILASLLAIWLLACFVLSLERDAPPQRPRISPARVGALPLAHPIGCDATMQLSVAGVVTHFGCYVQKQRVYL